MPIIGIALFVYILFKLDVKSILLEMREASIYWLFIAVLFIFVMLIIQTFKWYIVALFQGIKINFKDALKINVISNFYGFVTPSKLGGVVRAEYLKKSDENNNIGKGLFNFTIDKVLDLSSIVFMAILFSFVFKDKLELPITFFSALFLLFVLSTLFFINKDRSKYVLKFLYTKIIGRKIKDSARLTFDSFYDNIPKKRYFVLFFLLNILSWVSIYLILYFIGLSLGIDLGFTYYLAILPIGTLVAMIPISISGLGTREATMISLFALFGAEASKVFSMSIINILLVGIIPSLVGIWLIWRDKKNEKKD